MSDVDKSSKTEEPTGKRLGEAMKKGEFAKAQEIGVVITLIMALAMFAFTGKDRAAEVAHIAASIFGHLHEIELTERSVTQWAQVGPPIIGQIILPFLFALMIAAIIAGGIQSKFKLTLKALKIGLEKFNPMQGVKKIFSVNSAVQAGVDMLKFIAVSVVIYGAITSLMSDPIFYTPVHVTHTGQFIFEAAGLMFVRLIATLSIIAAIHYIFQLRKTKKDLMMTKEEVKDERKNADMDPKLKQAMRTMGMKMLQNQMLSETVTADVVVTNPTHFAVALRYEKGRDMAPVVVAKGEGHFALKIKRLAREHDVPIVENKPVARLLYRIGEVNESIPVELYEVVANILSHVYRKHRYYFHRLRSRREQMATAY